MKKILAIAVALILVMALSLTVFATEIDLSNIYVGTTVTGSSDELIGIMFPDGFSYNLGEKVTVHFVGSSTGDFRVWLSLADGEITMSPEPNWKASDNGFTSGDFDFTIELEVFDKDGKGNTTCDSIIFKGPSYGTPLDNFTLTLVEIVDGNDAAPAEPETTENEGEPEVTEPEAPAVTEAPAPATGLALAVVPAVMALAAVTVTKRR